MKKFVSHFLLVFVFLNAGLLFAQEAAPAAEATDAAAVETAAAADLGAMTYDELVAYLAALTPEKFANVVVEALYSGDRYLARRVVAAANQVIADAGENAQTLIDSVVACGGDTVVVQNNTIMTVAPQANTLETQFDVPSVMTKGVEIPPAEPTYSTGAAM